MVGAPAYVNTSFSASGTPASGPTLSPAATFASTRAAASSARSPSTYRKAWIVSSTAAIRSRWAWVTSTELISPDAIAAASSAAV